MDESAPRLSELSGEECVRLLASTEVGRVAVNLPGGHAPLIRPVNYVFHERAVVFRSARGSKFTFLTLTNRASFEIDGIDSSDQTGWSVIVVGLAEEVTNAAEVANLERSRLQPWAPGDKPHWIRIRPEVVSGRRIGRQAALGHD
jgi:nitroimidazol reductase NimA-like FMN-containing flavoprotein (pyridoxamine 5'-phosphate oxidase superfamily)